MGRIVSMKNKKKVILVAFFAILGLYILLNNPFDADGAIRATIEATVTPSQGQPIIVSSRVIGPREDIVINGSIVRFLNLTNIKKLAEVEGPIFYHEFSEFRFVIFGYKVTIDHLIWYPPNPTKRYSSCYGDYGIVSYKNKEWKYESRGHWLS